jgi:tetratricopeptide (TPR) repeat protein
MMKNICIISLVLAGQFSGSFKAQTTSTPDKIGKAIPTSGKQAELNQQQFELQQAVYKRAIELNDLTEASGALYTMIALRPERLDLNDSLCFAYMGRGMYLQSGKLAQEILARDPKKQIFKEVLAQSEENLGMYKEALATYEELVNETKKTVFLYKVAALQYLLKRMGECEANLVLLEKAPDAAKETVNLAYPGENPPRQDVPVLAAICNIRGVIAIDLNKLEEAKKQFAKALEYYPEFTMAKKNLEYLNGEGVKK